ncbi:PLP-dependent cysteine synthase family protein [Aquimarina sp. I32.4]|uniref:PLP-dependent cysteine synthase family protein n=1 Tax=Aquimarina sp. I32.4 TaxID=2053903 RepID=UPI000CDED5FB|nr:cysteine synthase family protein [Aquimarina sp. I32.4]
MAKNIDAVVGNTPLAEIHFTYKQVPRVIYAKLENFNMTGSIKDRMAYHIIKKSYATGELKKGDEIVEATSGNTGIAFAAIGKALGHPVKIFMPDWMSKERIDIIKNFGATIRLVNSEEGGFLGSIAMTQEYAKKTPNVFLPCQFDNTCNSEAHYKSTGPEIYEQLEQINKRIDAFVAGVGTGGTVMGVGKYLREKDAKIVIHPLEPSNSPTLTTGHKVGSHRIQGISDEFIPSIVKLKELDSIIQVDDGDAIIMAQKLAKEIGLGVGISSGANFLGAVVAQSNLSSKAVVATVFSDSNKKYLSTDICKEEPIKSNFISSDIELKEFKIIPPLEKHKKSDINL